MASQVVYKTLYEVQDAFVGWEASGKARSFGIALWETAEKCIKTALGDTFSVKDFQLAMCDELHKTGSFKMCLTENLRRFVVRHHARNISTTTAVQMILLDDAMQHVTPFYVLRHKNICGFRNIVSYLVERLGYLKRGHPRWPRKFDALWHEEREHYIDAIKSIPLSHPTEQLSKLSDHYQSLEDQYQQAEKAPDKERFHKCMIRTMAAIHAITHTSRLTSKHLPLPDGDKQAALAAPKSEDVIDVSIEPAVVNTDT